MRCCRWGTIFLIILFWQVRVYLSVYRGDCDTSVFGETSMITMMKHFFFCRCSALFVPTVPNKTRKAGNVKPSENEHRYRISGTLFSVRFFSLFFFANEVDAKIPSSSSSSSSSSSPFVRWFSKMQFLCWPTNPQERARANSSLLISLSLSLSIWWYA